MYETKPTHRFLHILILLFLWLVLLWYLRLLIMLYLQMLLLLYLHQCTLRLDFPAESKIAFPLSHKCMAKNIYETYSPHQLLYGQRCRTFRPHSSFYNIL